MHQGTRIAIARLCPCNYLTEDIRQSTMHNAPPDLTELSAEDLEALDPEPTGPFFLTLEARRYLRAVASWDWTRVLKFGCYCGLGYMCMSVLVGRMTNVLLSVLIEQVRPPRSHGVRHGVRPAVPSSRPRPPPPLSSTPSHGSRRPACSW